MSDVFIFGIYLGQNSNYDRTKTSTRFNSKFRSQFAVPQGTQINNPNNNELYLFEGTTVKLCYISDLDYQLKNTEPIDDDNWIYRANSARAESYYIGFNPQIQFEYVEVETNYVLDATNPNGDRFITPAPTPKPIILPNYISFAEERLELGYDYGAVGGPSFATEVIEVADDREQRNASKLLPLGRWQLGDRVIADSEINKLEEFSYLKQFHLDRLGCFQGFRFKDWADYQAFDQYIATGDGVETQFQLRKAYYAGNAVTYRPILKPVPGTVALYVDDVRVPDISEDPDNGWHINNETGVVTGNLATGARLTANFEFDVPVWFESDTIDFRLEYYDPETKDTVYRLGSVFVVEAPLPPSIPFDIEPSQKITEQLDLGIIYETTETYQISNNKLPLKSGYIRRENKREDNRIAFNLGSINYNQSEVDKLLGYFWNARGKSLEFPFTNQSNNYKVRFDGDSLNLKFLAAKSEDRLYQLSGLKLQLAPSKGFLDFIDRDTFVYIFIDTSGSMDSSIPSINQAIENLKTILVDRVYGTVEAMEEKVIQQNFSDERWVGLYSSNYAPKAVYLIWINEASPTYHSSTYAPPTPTFTEDLNNYLTSYSDRLTFTSIVYSINFDSAAYTTFQNHLLAAYNGTDGYPVALKNYQIQLRLNIPEATTAEEYFADFTGIQLLGDFYN